MSTVADEAVRAVREHVETVLADGRDRYGSEETPLLVDALDPDEREPVAYDGRDVASERRLANFAVQQEFLRTLDGLSRLTGDAQYRGEAESLVEWAFEHLTSDSGLLYWGGHVAYDVDADELATNKGGPHELKFEYPYYDLLYDVDPEATGQFVESFWTAHVCDWSTLDFNRHGDLNDWLNDEYDYAEDATDGTAGTWDRDYEGGDVFFWGNGLTFVNTGSDLYYAAGLLAALESDGAPLTWSERLASRYVETRQEPGISGYQFSQHPSYCNGPEIRGDRAQYQFAPYIPGDHLIYEGTLFRPRPVVQRRQLELGERLGEAGEAFTRWALEELRAWRGTAYRPDDNTFEPMLTDGYSLEGFVIRREGYYGPKGRVIGPIEADANFFWVYALAYRCTGDETCWRTARDIATGLGLASGGADGEADAGDAPGIDPRPDTEVADHRAVYGLLDLYRATDHEAYLDTATTVGENLLAERFEDGLFVDAEDGLAVLSDPAPLALLHLAAALHEEGSVDLPIPAGNTTTINTPDGGVRELWKERAAEDE